MTNLIEKTWFLGLGVLTLTRDKVTEAVDELVQTGKVEAEESRELIDELMEKGKAEQAELRALVDREINKLHGKVAPISREDFDALKQEVTDLRARLEDIEANSSSEDT